MNVRQARPGLALGLVILFLTAGGGLRAAYSAVQPAAASALAVPAPPGPGLIAAKSRLAYPAGADVWVDAEGTQPVTVPGVRAGLTARVSVIVFRPRGDNLTWDSFPALYAKQGILVSTTSEFSSRSEPKPEAIAAGGPANAEETNVYKTPSPGELLVLGLIRNLHSGHQLGYAVRINGKLTNVQALLQGQALANELGGAAQAQRSLAAQDQILAPVTVVPPPPPGSVPEPDHLITGPALAQLARQIQGSPLVSSRVKDMTRVVLPQATAVRLYKWQTAGPMTDQQFLGYYTQAALRLGWGQPISRDDTQLTRPTLLFQRPNGAGVAMVRAQPTPPTASRRGPSITIFVLIIEGRIDASALRGN